MPHILIIDDDITTRRFLQSVLEGEQHTVFTADNGISGTRIYRQEIIDLVILDLLMPERDGIDILRDLRANNPQTKIIVISGAARELLDVIKEIGADSTISKPIKAKELIEQVNQLLPASQA